MKQKTVEVLIIIAVVILNLWLLSGGHGGRTTDYQETQYYEGSETP